jgi:hypothetical protein
MIFYFLMERLNIHFHKEGTLILVFLLVRLILKHKNQSG